MGKENKNRYTGSKPKATKGIVPGVIAGGLSFALYDVILRACGGTLRFGSGLIGAAIALGIGALVKIMASGLDTTTHNRQDRDKKPDPLEEVIAQSGDPNADALIERSLKTLKEIHEEGVSLKDEQMSAAITRLEETGMAIFRAAAEKPARAGQIRKFTEYYLPTVLKLLRTCHGLREKGLSGQQTDETMERVTATIGVIADSCQKIITKLYRDDILDVTAEMDVLEKMLQRDGLTESDLEAAARQAMEAARIDEAAMRLTRQKEANRKAAENTKAHVTGVPMMNGGTAAGEPAMAAESK